MKTKIPKSLIVRFLQDNFGEVKETSSGELRINTPFDNDSKFHLYINPEKGVFNDFKSGESGTVIKFISMFLDINENEVIFHLIKEYSNKKDILDKVKTIDTFYPSEIELPEGLHFFTENNKSIMKNAALSYLRNRAIPEENIKRLGYIFEPGSEYDKTIFIPFYENGELVYFITRDFTGKNKLRYNNPHGVDSKNFVFNIDKINENEVFIFEGVFDALMLKEQIGTAMLSADFGVEQAKKIWNKTPKKIIFVPDNDKTGRNTLEKNINLLLKYKPQSVKCRVYVYYIEGVKDFGETKKNYIDIKDCVLWKKNNLFCIMKKMWNK